MKPSFIFLRCFGQEETPKAGAYVCWCVRTLVTLEQEGNISLINLEAQLETLLEGVVTFNPPGGAPPPHPTGSAAARPRLGL